MKWNPNDITQLPAKLKQSPIRCFLLHGNDSSRQQAVGADIIAHLKNLHKDLEHQRLEANAVAKGNPFLGDLLASGSLFGGTSLYDINGAGESFREVLEEANLEKTSHFLLIRVDESLTKTSKFGQWAEKAPAVAIIGCYAPELGDMAAMLRHEAANVGLMLEKDAASYLAAQMAGDSMAVRMEMEKLLLYKGGPGNVTLEDVKSAVPSYEHESADKLLAALLRRDGRMLAHQLNLLEAEQTSGAMVHRLMAGNVMRLIAVRQALDGGLPMEQAAMKARPPFFFKQQDLLKATMRDWPLQELTRLMQGLLAMEGNVKMNASHAYALLLHTLAQPNAA
jgi:DNA polymerase-3 subunit delta